MFIYILFFSGMTVGVFAGAATGFAVGVFGCGLGAAL